MAEKISLADVHRLVERAEALDLIGQTVSRECDSEVCWSCWNSRCPGADAPCHSDLWCWCSDFKARIKILCYVNHHTFLFNFSGAASHKLSSKKEDGLSVVWVSTCLTSCNTCISSASQSLFADKKLSCWLSNDVSVHWKCPQHINIFPQQDQIRPSDPHQLDNQPTVLIKVLTHDWLKTKCLVACKIKTCAAVRPKRFVLAVQLEKCVKVEACPRRTLHTFHTYVHTWTPLLCPHRPSKSHSCWAFARQRISQLHLILWCHWWENY